MPIDDTKIMVYRKADFKDAIKAAERARDLYGMFYASVADPAAAGPRQQLLSDSQVRLQVERLARHTNDETRAMLNL